MITSINVFKQLYENSVYQGSHKIVKYEGEYATLDDMTKNDIISDDFYTHMHYYYNTHNPIDKQSAAKIKAYQNKPDELVTIYRSVPKGVTTINPGDWITINKQYAIDHGKHHDDPSLDWPVISMQVPAKYVIWDGNDINEFAYYPE